MLQKMARERQKKKEESDLKVKKDGNEEPKLIIPSLAKMEKNYRPGNLILYCNRFDTKVQVILFL